MKKRNRPTLRRARLLCLMLATTLCSTPLCAQNAEEANPDLDLEAAYTAPENALVRAHLDQWQDLKFGMIIHWGLYAVPGIVESWSICSEDVDWIPRDSTLDYEQYKQWYWGLSKSFNPTQFNPDQWAATAEQAGMKYVIFTTKHHDGFAMYDTKYSDFSIAKGPFRDNPKADVARHVFDAFRAKKMMVGAYYSKPDWHSQDYWWSHYATPDRHVNYTIANHPQRWENFTKFVYNQIDEITANYGPIDILWLDGGWVRAPQEDIHIDDIVERARQNQPSLIVVDRTVTGKHENYRTPEKMIPDQQLPYPWETCMPLSKDWGYVPGATFKTPQQVVSTLVEVVAKGGSLLLGVGPTPEGIIEPAVVACLNPIGQWMQRNGEAIYNTRPMAQYHSQNVWFTGSKDSKCIYALATTTDGNITWNGNLPRKGGRITDLATGKRLPYRIQGDTITVKTKPTADGYPVALRIDQ